MKPIFKLNYFNKQRLLIIILICYSFPAFLQNSSGFNFKAIESAEYVATYSLKYKRDSLNLDRVQNQESYLFLGKNISYFVSKHLYLDLQALSKFKTSAELQFWAANKGPYKARFLYHIYKNYPKGKITYTESSLSGYFKYEEKLNEFNWQLYEDTATIAGYRTQKASCNYGGRNWTAWFSTEIPFNDGPYKFNGLPGLIVKIYDSREHYVFELIGLEVADPDLMIEINDYHYIQTTKEKFFKAREASRNDNANFLKTRMKGNKSAQEKAMQVIASRNNHIELKIDKQKE